MRPNYSVIEGASKDFLTGDHIRDVHTQPASDSAHDAVHEAVCGFNGMLPFDDIAGLVSFDQSLSPFAP